MTCISFPSYTVPSSPPTAFTVTVLSDTSLRLNWRAPPVEDWNYRSLSRFYYCVVPRTPSYTFSSCSTSGSVSFQTDPNFDYSYEIAGLQPLTEYLLSVRAYSIQGYSPYTREISATTTGKVASLFVPHNNAYRMHALNELMTKLPTGSSTMFQSHPL